jgi:hypothetical protein
MNLRQQVLVLYPAYWLQPNSLNTYASAFCMIYSLVRPRCGQHSKPPRLNSIFCYRSDVDTLRYHSRLTLPWIPLLTILTGYEPFFTLFSVLGVGPDPKAASPSARRRSICYPQHSARGRRRYHCIVHPLEKAIKSSHTSRLMVYLYYYLIYEGIVLK